MNQPQSTKDFPRKAVRPYIPPLSLYPSVTQSERKPYFQKDQVVKFYAETHNSNAPRKSEITADQNFILIENPYVDAVQQ